MSNESFIAFKGILHMFLACLIDFQLARWGRMIPYNQGRNTNGSRIKFGRASPYLSAHGLPKMFLNVEPETGIDFVFDRFAELKIVLRILTKLSLLLVAD